jgi:hypothetical protein
MQENKTKMEGRTERPSVAKCPDVMGNTVIINDEQKHSQLCIIVDIFFAISETK